MRLRGAGRRALAIRRPHPLPKHTNREVSGASEGGVPPAAAMRRPKGVGRGTHNGVSHRAGLGLLGRAGNEARCRWSCGATGRIMVWFRRRLTHGAPPPRAPCHHAMRRLVALGLWQRLVLPPLSSPAPQPRMRRLRRLRTCVRPIRHAAQRGGAIVGRGAIVVSAVTAASMAAVSGVTSGVMGVRSRHRHVTGERSGRCRAAHAIGLT